jgi:hypothetical protein
MKRLVLPIAGVILMVAFVPVATGSMQPRLPTSAEDWTTFSAAEQAAALQYEWDLLQQSLRDGTAVIHQVGMTQSGQLEQVDGLAAVTITYDYNCPIQWVDQVGGAWFRGGGWTDTSSNVYYIAASRNFKRGQFLRDGVLSGTWWDERNNASHAEHWSSWSWRWMFEYIHWVNKGWHTIQQTSGGPKLLDDKYCKVDIYR